MHRETLQQLTARRDLPHLTRRLPRYAFDEATFTRLVVDPERGVAHAALLWLKARIAHWDEHTRLRWAAAQIPADLTPWSDAARLDIIALAVELRRLGAALPTLPEAPTAALEIEWLRAAVLMAPQRMGPWRPRLARALEGLQGLHRVVDPLATGAALVALERPEADARAFEIYEAAWRAGRTSPAALRQPILGLLERRCRRATRCLSGPLGAGIPIPTPQAGEDPTWRLELIDPLRARGDVDRLWALLDGPVRVTRAALRALGHLVEAAAPLIEAGAAHPEALEEALRHAHRRGVFVKPRELPRLVEIWGSSSTWSGAALADLCYTAREALPEPLKQAFEAQPLWRPRIIEALERCPTEAARGVLRTLTYEALEISPPPVHLRGLLEALTRREGPEAEPLLIRAIPIHPISALEGLARVGGAGAVAAIEMQIEALPRREALGALWALCPSDDDARRAALLERIDALEPPERLTRDLKRAASAPQRRLRRRIAETQRPDKALITLAALGEEADLPRIQALMPRICLGLESGEVPPDVGGPRLRMVIPHRVVEALRAYGAALESRGRVNAAPLRLPGAATANVTAWICLEALEDPEIGVGAHRALIEVASDQGGPWAIQRLSPLLRSKEPTIQAEAARGLVKLGGDALGFSLSRLLEHGAVGVAAAAVEAIGAFKLRAATPALARLLSHPKMTIKNAAADALTALDPTPALPQILEGLERWDNQGFRARLLAAYDAAEVGAGPLLGALWSVDAEARARLIPALSRRLTPEGVAALVEAGHPAAEGILEAVAGRAITLSGGDEIALGLLLRRMGRARPPRLEPELDITQRLLRLGWDEDDARAVLREGPPWGLLQRFGVELLGLLPRLKGDERAHLAASLERLPQLDEALEALPALRGALGPLAARPELSGLLGLLRKLAPRLMGPAAMALLEEVRALPPGPGGGLARWRLLTALTKQLTYDDLQAALRDCALQPKPTRARLLEEAFQIRLGGATPLPAERAPEPEQLAGALAATEHAPPEREEALLRWAIEQRPLGLPLWRPEAAKAPRAKPTTEQRVAALKGAEALEAAIWLLERATQPEAHRAVMVAYLDGLMLPLDALPCLAQRLTPADLEHPRAYTLLEHLHPDQRRWALTPLLSRWADGDEAAKAALSSMPRDAVVAEVRARVAEGSPGAVRLLSEAEIERHPELVKAAKALGALSPPSREPPTPQRAFARDPEARRAQLAAEALSEDLEVARAALSALEARGWGDAALYLDILQGGAPKLRLAALRGLKKVAPGEAYLEAVEGCLEDERRPDVEAQLIRALAYSGYEPAARALVARLNHNHKKIREDARLGVRRLGAAALRELHRAARRARPDQRSIYAALIEELEER